ncbi:MAG: ribbon-helix-helix domain-containing protein [Bryobacteraceae bacterium]
MKKGSLGNALQKVATQVPSRTVREQPESLPARPPSRAGKKAIAGFFDEAASKQLRRLGLDQDKTIQELLGEAINDLFEKYGLSRIA